MLHGFLRESLIPRWVCELLFGGARPTTVHNRKCFFRAARNSDGQAPLVDLAKQRLIASWIPSRSASQDPGLNTQTKELK
jgi:hypothetical protein